MVQPISASPTVTTGFGNVPNPAGFSNTSFGTPGLPTGFAYPSPGIDPLFLQQPATSSNGLNRLLGYAGGINVNVNFGPPTDPLLPFGFLRGTPYFGGSLPQSDSLSPFIGGLMNAGIIAPTSFSPGSQPFQLANGAGQFPGVGQYNAGNPYAANQPSAAQLQGQASGSPYPQQAQAPYAAPQQASPYGDPYGGQLAANPYAAMQQASPYGDPYGGQLAANPYGNPYGQAAALVPTYAARPDEIQSYNPLGATAATGSLYNLGGLGNLQGLGSPIGAIPNGLPTVPSQLGLTPQGLQSLQGLQGLAGFGGFPTATGFQGALPAQLGGQASIQSLLSTAGGALAGLGLNGLSSPFGNGSTASSQGTAQQATASGSSGGISSLFSQIFPMFMQMFSALMQQLDG
ncbi:MAG: hypothetical protein KC475_06750 [Cyanobacteria bacterium HKST-UBA03]|nr:hypothetical protein [Cyanobacteria bacterium HKST-UBA03]